MTAVEFWSMPENERFAYLRKSLRGVISTYEPNNILTLPAILAIAKQDPTISGQAGTAEHSNAARRLLRFINEQIRDDDRVYNPRPWMAWARRHNFEAFKAQLAQAAAAHPAVVTEEIDSLLVYIDGNKRRFSDAMGVVLREVAEGQLDWSRHKSTLRRVFPHVVDYANFTPETLQAVWESSHRLELFNLLAATWRSEVLQESIDHPRCNYSFHSFRLALVLHFILISCRRTDGLSAERLNKRWNVNDVFTDDWESDIGTFLNTHEFLARVPAVDKSAVEAVISLIWLWLFYLDASGYIGGIPCFSESAAVPTKAAWLKLTESNLFKQRFSLVLDSAVYSVKYWRSNVERGLVNVAAVREGGYVNELFKALSYSANDTSNVFFRERIFWL